MSTPNSWVNICSGTGLNNRYIHTAFFESKSAQWDWFDSKVVKTYNKYTYLRKNWNLKVEASMTEALKWDYLFFGNSDGKTWYYFITDIQYINDSTVELSLELDVIQTHLFDFTCFPCYIDRMHTTDDTFGNNTVEEGLSVDEFVVNSQEQTDIINDLAILVQSTRNPGLTTEGLIVEALPQMYDRVFSGVTLFAVHRADWEEWGDKIDELSKLGQVDMIVSMWMYPHNLIKLGGESEWGDGVLCKTVEGSQEATFTITGRPDNLNGYEPKNNKLFCYPYSFLYATNNAGESAVFRYERFRDSDGDVRDTLNFVIHGSLGADASVHIYPEKYNGLGLNYHEGMTLSNFPTCAWESDIYKMWLAQNQNQRALAQTTADLKIVGGAVAGIAGLATGNFGVAAAGAGAAVNGAMQIAELNAQRADMSIVPPQARGSHSCTVNVAYGRQHFTFQRKSISYEYAKKIDDYFTMFGYKLGRCETPRFNHRKSHCYIKTIDCKIKANFCADDSAKIESIFDKGVTFWRNPDGMGDYSRDNSII